MIEMNSTDPVVTLRAQAKKFDFSKLRADEKNTSANSGEQMYKDINRIDFVINSKSIDKILTGALIAGAKQREFDKIWNTHYENDSTPNQYKEEFERFYNLGKGYASLLPEDENKNYRTFVKEVFKEMFKYAEAKVPGDPILEELVTNCNQAAYVGALYGEGAPISHLAGTYRLLFKSDHVTVISNEVISVSQIDNPEKEVDQINSSLEFTLESQDGKDCVTYKDGKLLLTAPRELESYRASGEEEQLYSDTTMKKSLIDKIIESFLILIEKFINVKPENRQNIYDMIKNVMGSSCNSEVIIIKDTGHSPLKIECSLGNPLEVNGHLESVEPSVHNNEHGTVP